VASLRSQHTQDQQTEYRETLLHNAGSCAMSLRRKAGAPDQLLKTGISAKWIKAGIDFEI